MPAPNAYTIDPDVYKPNPISQVRVDKYMLLEKLRSKLMSNRTPYEAIMFDVQQVLDPHLVITNMYQAGFPEFVTDLFLTSRHLQSFDDLTSGLMEGIFPSHQTWAKYGLAEEDSDLGKSSDTWNYLHTVTSRAQTVLGKSNWNIQAPITLRSTSRFGTGAIMMERDKKKVVRFTSFPVGSYWISNNSSGQVDTFMRMFRMTARQAVEEFCTDDDGRVTYDNMSNLLQSFWADPALHEEWVDVVMFIFPNPEYNKAKAKYDSKYERYSINYYEYGKNIGQKFLREEGSPYFPVYCPRWFRQPTDQYGVDCPGIKARSEIRQLFKSISMELSSMQKVLEPPMVADPSVPGVVAGSAGTTPNFLTVSPGGAGEGKSFGPAYQIKPDLSAIQNYIMKLEQNIDRLTMADIFRALSSLEGKTPLTATEVLERVKENSRVLGPVMGSFNFDWIQPMMRDLYWIMLDEKIIPPAPPALHGIELKVEVVSSIAMALKQSDIQAIQTGIGIVSNLASVKGMPGTERLNSDEVLDYVFRALNLSPKLLYSEQQVAQIRQAINQQKQQQAQAEQAEQMSKTAKNLAGAGTGGDKNLLQHVMGGQNPNGGLPSAA